MTGDTWQDFLSQHLGKILGVILGLLLGWMIIEYGFFKTLLVIIFVAVGFLVGKKADDNEDVLSAIRRFFKGY